jgi:BetI-type transcriptional repressor, C-terminal
MSLSWIHLQPDFWARAEPDRPEATRRFVHAAGVTVLEQGLDVLVRGIDLDRTVERSGRSRRTFYDKFHARPSESHSPDAEPPGPAAHGARRELVAQLVRETCDPLRSSTTAELGAQLTQVVAPSTEADEPTLDDLIRRYTNDQYHEVLDDDIHRLQSLVWALGQDDDDVCAAFRSLYSSWVEVVASGVAAIVESHHRRLIAPFTPELVATSLTALIEGLATRARVDPDAVPIGLFGELVVGLIRGITEDAR